MYTLTRFEVIKIRDILSETQDTDAINIIAVLNDCLIDRVEQIKVTE